MDRFVSTFTNKIDAKGRVSVPALFRAVLERDAYGGPTDSRPADSKPADSKPADSKPADSKPANDTSDAKAGGGIYCYPSLDAPALDAGGERLARKIDRLLAGLPDYSDERDQLSVALYGDVQVLSLDGDGRIVLPEALRAHAGIGAQVTFVGLGDKFQIWQPERFAERRDAARAKVHQHRRLFAGGQGGGGEGGAGGGGEPAA